MTILITLLHIVFCLVLVVVILVQGGRGQGITGPAFGSGNVQSLFGTRAADFLTKATSVSAICFLFTCIGLNIMENRKSKSLLETARRPAVPVDVEAIKKALEKVKQEGAKEPVVTTGVNENGQTVVTVKSDAPAPGTSKTAAVPAAAAPQAPAPAKAAADAANKSR